jgi:hypothetical protein
MCYHSLVAQMTLYLDAETEEKVRVAARQAGKSLSRWAGEQLAKAAGAGKWPDGYFDLFGSVDDESFRVAEEIPRSIDTKREEL